MNSTIRRAFRACAAVAAVLCLCSVVQAQTGPELLLRPWPKGQWLQTDGDFTLQNTGSTRNSDDFQLTFYDTSGRVRLLSEQRADPRFGWNYTDINTSGDAALPSHLTDTSVGFGMGVADWKGWVAGITLGVGYAGAGAFDDSNAYYGMADLLLGRDFGKDSSLGLVIDYNGNRSFMPDVPMLGFLYTKRIDTKLLLGLGFPYNSIEYKPNSQFTIRAKYAIPDAFEANIDYAIVRNFGVFAEYGSWRHAFHWDALPDGSDRLLYEARHAEIGVRWTARDSISLTLAGGYAFGQEFNVGFDTRDQDRVAKPSDEPYLHLGFEIRY